MMGRRNIHWWTSLLVLTFTGLLVVFAYVARRPLCIDSKLVERIDSVSSAGTATAYRCGLHRHVGYDQILANQTRDLGRRLQKLEKVLDWIKPLQQRVNLTVIEGNGNHYRIRDHEIFISESILKSQGQLEKAFLKIWFRENANLNLQGQFSVEESLTDFLYFALIGDFKIQHPITGIVFNQESEARWPQVLMNFKGYCKSLWKSNEHDQLCEDSLIEARADEIYQPVLRPLLSQTLMEAFGKLTSQERLDFLKLLPVAIQKAEFHEKNFGMSYLEPHQQTYHEAVINLENWAYFLLHLVPEQSLTLKFSHYFDSAMKRRGFNESAPQTALDVLIVSDESSQKVSDEIQKQLKSKIHKLIGFESKGELQMGFENEPLSLKVLGPIQATSGILLHCGTPSLAVLKSFSHRVQKLLYVNACEKDSVRLEGFINKGVSQFAMQNPKLKFAELHMPSLMMALQKAPSMHPIESVAEKKKELLNPLGWQEPTYDESIKAYRANSAIEMVDWFRL
jgi:hypothetical protein